MCVADPSLVYVPEPKGIGRKPGREECCHEDEQAIEAGAEGHRSKTGEREIKTMESNGF